MFDMPVVEVAIGLTFVFLVLSMCATALVEGLVEWRQWRGRLLFSKLRSMLGAELSALFYKERRVVDLASGAPHEWPKWSRWFLEWLNARGRFTTTSYLEARCIAAGMNARRLPSYVPDSVFADVLLDWLQGVGLPELLRPEAASPAQVPEHLAELWQRMNRRADGDQVALRGELLTWFQQCTDRTTGEFKRRTKLALYAMGILLVIATNADTIRIVRSLHSNPQVRAQVVASADMVRACPTGGSGCPELREEVRKALARSNESALSGLIGWHATDRDALIGSPGGAIEALLGWLLTVMAIGLGADFWVGALKKVLTIRNPKQLAASSGEAKAQVAGEPQPDTPAPRTSPAREPLNVEQSAVAGLKGFQPYRFAESNIHAYWLAQFASLAYGSVRDLEQSNLLKVHGLEVKSFDRGSTQAFLFTGGDRCIVAFRGTEKLLEDWLADLDARHAPSPWGLSGAIGVHAGFHGALEAVWADLHQALTAVRCPVWFTGHSLGGALAVLAAYRLHHCESASGHTVAGVYTFGQPRVGNAALASFCSAELAQRVFRYVNASDIVPLVPPSRPLDYQHLGQPRYFDATGRLHHERTLWERMAEQVTPAFRQVVSGDGKWTEATRDHARQRLMDHGMARYVECLERIDAVRALWAA
jgi:triacylglycerol lipase